MSLHKTVLHLRPGLVQEVEFSPVVELPRDTVQGKESLVSDGRAGSIFAHARRIDYQRPLRQRSQQRIVAARISIQNILYLDGRFYLFHDGAQPAESVLLIVDHEKAPRPIFRMGLGEQV